jgi:hypothetical protein
MRVLFLCAAKPCTQAGFGACAGLSHNRKMAGLAQGNHRLRVAAPQFLGDSGYPGKNR